MKYLKLFEELNYENSKLTEDEFYDEVGDGLELIDFDNFNEKEIEKIRSFVHQVDPKWSCGLVRKDTTKFPPLGIMLNCEWFKSGGGYVHNMTGRKNRVGGPAIDIEVIKNTDSWYYIKRTIFEEKRGRRGRVMDEIITYYKCDQLEGLLETLKEILIYTI